LTLPEENVILLGQSALRATSPEAQKVVDFLNHSAVRFVLLLLACLAALIELKTAGSFLAGALSCIFFGIFFLAASFPTTGSIAGTASLWEISLFAVGAVLLGVELFLLPGMGIFGISGAALCLISIVLALVPADSSQLAGDTSMTDAVIDSLALITCGFGAGCLFFLVILKLFSRRFSRVSPGLVTSSTIAGVATAESALAAQAADALLVGQEGFAATLLRPAGKVELTGGKIIDVVTDGELVEKGTPVHVVSVTSGIIKVARRQASQGR
jgi:membrane-bound serine protease (ClpP class)